MKVTLPEFKQAGVMVVGDVMAGVAQLAHPGAGSAASGTAFARVRHAA